MLADDSIRQAYLGVPDPAAQNPGAQSLGAQNLGAQVKR
jgi:hypothetical protein